MPTGEEWDRASCHEFTSPPGTEYLKYSLLQDAQDYNIPVEITGSGGATFVQSRPTYKNVVQISNCLVLSPQFYCCLALEQGNVIIMRSRLRM